MTPVPFDLLEVVRLSGLSERKIMTLMRAGLVGSRSLPRRATEDVPRDLSLAQPPAQKGSSAKIRFSFRDLKVARMAAALMFKGLRFGRATRALILLKGQAEARDIPLSGTSVVQQEGRLLASDGDRVWDIEAGCEIENDPRSAVPTTEVTPTSQLSGSLVDKRRWRHDQRQQQRRVSDSALPLRCHHRGADTFFEQALAQEEQLPAKAFVLYLRALACDPEHVESLINAGRLSSADDDPERAKRYFRLATRIDPAHPVAHFNLAVTLHDGGDDQGAIDAYRQTLLHDPHFADAHYNLGGLLEKRGETQEAFQHFLAFRRSLEQTPSP